MRKNDQQTTPVQAIDSCVNLPLGGYTSAGAEVVFTSGTSFVSLTPLRVCRFSEAHDQPGERGSSKRF